MSRSFRHRGWLTGLPGRKFGKRLANHIGRRAADVPSGRCYRKFYCSYNIRDYVFRLFCKIGHGMSCRLTGDAA